MKSRVHKWGNSLALRIPKSFAIEVGLRNDSAVEIALESGRLIVTPVAEPELTLVQLLEQVTENNVHGEVDSGPVQGKETW